MIFHTRESHSLMQKRPEPLELEILISAGNLDRFTPLLQAGLFLECSGPQTVGELLASLPGFSWEYITGRIETIFLNGLPVDDLTTPIKGSQPVLALSAAMPGLAGAIFRKNSFHVHLRTTAQNSVTPVENGSGIQQIRLKLFNFVSRERGGDLLREGCLLQAESMRKFIATRQALLAGIIAIRGAGSEIKPSHLVDTLEHADMIMLKIREDNDRT